LRPIQCQHALGGCQEQRVAAARAEKLRSRIGLAAVQFELQRQSSIGRGNPHQVISRFRNLLFFVPL
jgi:hypothetical protein